MMNRRTTLLAAMCTCVALVAAGCAADDVEPTVPAAGELLEAEEAFHVAVEWLQLSYPDMAPAEGLAWVVEDIEVRGPNGEPLLGAAEKRMTSADWEAEVTWAVVAPEFMQYQISLVSRTLGRFWEGSVKAQGGKVLEEVDMQSMTVELAEEIAWQFVKAAPTYMSSGMSETFEFIESVETGKPFTWNVVFEFDSRHSGYGDTSGQVVLQVITPHRAVVTVEAMAVTSATMDNRWDMLAQEYVVIAEEDALDIAGMFVRYSPTFIFDGIPGTLELIETLQPDIENAWSFVFRFDSAHAGYGDRTGQMLAEVITPHEAHVTVQNGEVVSALMDGQWDMLQQKTVS